MSNNKTWIKLYRSIEDNEFYLSEKFTKTQAWIDLLIITNRFPKTFYVRGNEVKVKAGQIGRSIVTLAKRWKWNERTVTKFLKTLENRKMIQYKSDSITTIITILNWKTYQGDVEQNTQQNTEQMQSRVQTNNKDKKEKNDEKRDISTSSNIQSQTSSEKQGELLTDTNTNSSSAPKKFEDTSFFMIDTFVNTFAEINGCSLDEADKFYSKFVRWKKGSVKLTEEGWKIEFKKWYDRR